MATVGWTPGPNKRGSFDIVWSCAQTLMLCAWSSISINLPAHDHKRLDAFWDKMHSALLAFAGPELVFIVAFAQYMSARVSRHEFQDAGYEGWSLTHAFYANAGGIAIMMPDGQRFPISAKQVLFLVTHGYMEYPDLALRDIEARSKVDGLGRLVTIVQTMSFVVTTIARLPQGLAITTLELTILGFVLCTLATSICWWHKPTGVQIGHIYKIKFSLDDILVGAGRDTSREYRDTPLDFISDDPWAGQSIWLFWVNILRRLGLFRTSGRPKPIQRFSSFDAPRYPTQASHLIVCGLALIYTAIFIAAWDFCFPSPAERKMWRACALMQMMSLTFGALFEFYYYTDDWWKSHEPWDKNNGLPGDTINCKTTMSRMRQLLRRPINIDPSRHPSYDIPLRSLLVTTPFGAIYCLCRAYLLLEDVISLRSQPASTYETVDWAKYLPFF